MPRQTKKTPIDTAFAVAQQKASTSAAVGLREAALDLTQGDFVDGVDATRAALTKAYKAAGITGDEDIRDEAGYLYGLAVGVAIGRGGAK